VVAKKESRQVYLVGEPARVVVVNCCVSQAKRDQSICEVSMVPKKMQLTLDKGQ